MLYILVCKCIRFYLKCTLLFIEYTRVHVGRTGMMISAWLVRSGLFVEAGKSLAYFSDRRTDKNLGNKSQGVETPSQSRYVIYYERLLTEMSGSLPPPVSLKITKMTINGLLGE